MSLENPTDREEITLFSADTHLNIVKPVRCVYHVDTPMNDVVEPHDEFYQDGRGKNFEGEWARFRQGLDEPEKWWLDGRISPALLAQALDQRSIEYKLFRTWHEARAALIEHRRAVLIQLAEKAREAAVLLDEAKEIPQDAPKL